MNPDITIMIPAHNVEKFIEECVGSAINQTYKGSFEIVIVNDGSTDRTGKKLETLQRQTPNKIHLIHQSNQGVSATRNTLLQESKGTFVLGLDSDDKLSSNAVEKVFYTFMQNPRTEFVYSDHVKIGRDGTPLKKVRKAKEHKIFDDLILHKHFPGHVRAFKRSSIETHLFNPSLKNAEDYDFLLQLLLNNWPHMNRVVAHIPELLYFYRFNPEGISQTQTREMRYNAKTALERRLKEHAIYRNRKVEIAPIYAIGSNGGEYRPIGGWDHIVEGIGSILDKKKVSRKHFNPKLANSN